MVLALVSLGGLAPADGFEDEIVFLKGIEEICANVIITYYSSTDRYQWESEFADQLTKEVTLQLRKARITVAPDCVKATAAFNILLTIVNIAPNRYLCVFETRLYQKVRLERALSMKPFLSSTYRRTGLDGYRQFPVDEEQYIRDVVRNIVDDFTKDYRSVNPK
jgi:hypothetical protein